MITLSPSNAHRWIECTGSIILEQEYKKPFSPAAEEGTFAHKIAADLLTMQLPTRKREILNDTMDKDIDPEMREAVLLYIRTICKTINLDIIRFHIENRIRLKINEKVYITGTPDIYLYDKDLNIMHIFDFKYGFGPVEIKDNWQLIIYLILARSCVHKKTEAFDNITIVQPRGYHPDGPVRSYQVIKEKLACYENKLFEICDLIANGKYSTRVGSWCRYCNALHACNSAIRAGAYAQDYANEPSVYELTPSELSIELLRLEEAIRLLTHRQGALEEQAKNLIKQGIPVPDWDLRPGRGILAWNRNTDEVEGMAKMLGIDVLKEKALITPRQAEAKGLPASVLQHYTYTKQGAIQLKHSDSNEGRKAFGD